MSCICVPIQGILSKLFTRCWFKGPGQDGDMGLQEPHEAEEREVTRYPFCLGRSNLWPPRRWPAEKTAWQENSGSSGWPKADHQSAIRPCGKEGQHFSGVRWSFSFIHTCSGASGLLDSVLGSSVEEKQGACWSESIGGPQRQFWDCNIVIQREIESWDGLAQY